MVFIKTASIFYLRAASIRGQVFYLGVNICVGYKSGAACILGRVFYLGVNICVGYKSGAACILGRVPIRKYGSCNLLRKIQPAM